MSCRSVTLPNGVRAIVCTRARRSAHRCEWCAAESRYQCDAIKAGTTSKICNAYLCEQHATHFGANRDLCSRHAEGAMRQLALDV
ncbi:MAG TPA: hypothetical protein VGE96_00890 [Steroidobacteraceae bacterium]|jgi:hypothetical protein